MLSAFFKFVFLGSAIVMLIKNNVPYFFICMGLCSLFSISLNLSCIYRVLKQLEKSYSDKVLAEKTFSALMSAARKAEDDGK